MMAVVNMATCDLGVVYIYIYIYIYCRHGTKILIRLIILNINKLIISKIK